MANEYGIQKDWKSWSRMTQSDFYCGIHRGVQDYCPAYVTPEEFLKFQERETIKGTPTGAKYYFRGLMRCSECGHKLCGNLDGRKAKKYKTYRCAIRGKGCTNHMSLSELKIEKQLLLRLEEFVEETIAEAKIEKEKPRPKSENTIKALKERLRRLNVTYMAGNKTDEEYFTEDAEIKLLIAKAEREQPETPRNYDHLQELIETDFRSLYSKFSEDEKQEFWQDLIREIKLDGKTIDKVLFHGR